MIVPIGKITESNKIVGLVAFDTDLCKKRILTMEEAYDIARVNNSVCGMTTYKKYNGSIQVTKSKQYIWDRIPECNGKGLPENNETVYTLVGRYIDSKSKKRLYIICDSYGNTELEDKNSVLDMLANIKIIGLTKTKNNNVNSYMQSFLNENDMKHLGYENEKGTWRKVGV